MARRPRPSARRRLLADFPPDSFLDLADRAVEAVNEARVALIGKPRDCAKAEQALDYAQSRVDRARTKGRSLPRQEQAIADARHDFVALCVWNPTRRKRSSWWPLRGSRARR